MLEKGFMEYETLLQAFALVLQSNLEAKIERTDKGINKDITEGWSKFINNIDETKKASGLDIKVATSTLYTPIHKTKLI